MGSSPTVLILFSFCVIMANGFWDTDSGGWGGHGGGSVWGDHYGGKGWGGHSGGNVWGEHYDSYGGKLSCHKCEQIVMDLCKFAPAANQAACIATGTGVCHTDLYCNGNSYGKLSCTQCAHAVDVLCDQPHTPNTMTEKVCLAQKEKVCEANNCKDKYDTYGGSGYHSSKYDSGHYGSVGSYSHGGGYSGGHGAGNGYGSGSYGSYGYGGGYSDNGYGDDGYGDNGYGAVYGKGHGDNGYGKYNSYKPYKESSGYTIGKKGGSMKHRGRRSIHISELLTG